ncbi:hypothetical protein [Mycobacterium sp. M23085]|uniref:hypothetical protein n=1 Tax=Mycobacterium sp. M23085 TaxID=3378087 RepID=UPI003877B993
MADNQTGAKDAAAFAAASGETKIPGVDQDSTSTGASDAVSGLATQKGNVANQQASGSQFTRGQG